MKKKEVAIIGGGASGMLAAISAARQGAKVTIFEHNNKLGKKILATGNGKCNLTNSEQSLSKYFGQNPAIVEDVFQQFDYKATLDFFMSLGIFPKNKNGYIYPYSEQASSVLDVLTYEINNLNISCHLEVEIDQVGFENKKFYIYLKKKVFSFDALIMAIGGKASPVSGSDGSGFKFVKKFGHRLSPLLPALVQLKAKEKFFKEIAGVRVEGSVQLLVENKVIAREHGEIQLTKYGISGIPVMQISRFASKALFEKEKLYAEMDFFPQMNQEKVFEMLRVRANNSKNKNMREFFSGLFNNKLGNIIIKQSGFSLEQKVISLKEKDFRVLAKTIKQFRVSITETNSFDQAQVTAGGVLTNEINCKTMESKIVPQLFFAGEMVDIDGTCGGYNLQWAWSSGFVAGFHSAK